MLLVSVFSGLVIGGLLGWALQMGGFCMNTAFRSVLFREDRSVLRAWVLVLLINLPGVALMESFGIIYPAKAPFTPWALIPGGLLFGAGMVWAGGCVSGSYYKAAKGTLGSVLALLGFATGALATSTGALSPLRSLLTRSEWTVYGEIPTLAHLLPMDTWTGKWIVIPVLAVPALIFLIRAPKTRFTIGWSWPVTGAVIGVLALSSWYFSSLEGRDYGLSLVQPTAAWGYWLFTGDGRRLNWTAWMLAALPAGAFLAAWKGKDLRLRLPEPRQLITQFFGGLAMGAGASLAGGCNIGHGITGISTLALSSVAATGFTLIGNWGATALVWSSVRRNTSAVAQKH